MKESFSRLIDGILEFEATRLPLWILMVIASTLFMNLGFVLGVHLHPLLFLLFTSVPIYPLYLAKFKVQQYRRVLRLIFVWAFTISLNTIVLTSFFTSAASEAVISGASYQQDMFLWLSSGVGPEGDPSTFIPEHLMNAVIFTTLSLATGGFLALIFGAYQMNYMNFYVGTLLTRVTTPTPENLIRVAFLSWPIYSLIRVVGFISIGVATTIPMANTLFNRKIESRPLVHLMIVGIACITLDIVIKALVAPLYQVLLKELVSV